MVSFHLDINLMYIEANKKLTLLLLLPLDMAKSHLNLFIQGLESPAARITNSDYFRVLVGIIQCCYKIRRSFVTKCVRCHIMRSCYKNP